MPEPLLTEKEYWGLFEISILIKGLTAIAEIVGGIVIWFTSKIVLVTFILDFFKNELSDSPNDYVGNFIVSSAEALAVGSQYFFSAYLLFHGILKVILLFCLYKKKLWAYPLSIIVFSIIIFYEIYSCYLSYSSWTLLFIVFDTMVVLLTGHEYGVLKKKHKKHEK